MSRPNIYALFIGINNYENTSISNLQGCVKDAESVATWLQNKVDTSKCGLSILKLYSQYQNNTSLPTRNNILKALQAYVGKLKKEDTFLLFYAGHGSTEIAHTTLQSSTGILSTLVPCDSGIKQADGRPVFDILSIEIRNALYQIWKDTQPKILFIQDSCHSERASRAYGEKNENLSNTAQARIVLRSPNMGIARRLDEFELSVQARNLMQNGTNLFHPQYNALPMAEHVHIAACAFDQYAYEDKDEKGEMGGVFTRNLLEILNLSNANISYKELANRLNLSIDGIFKQSPNIYVPEHKKELLYQQFLDINNLKKDALFNLVVQKKQDSEVFLLDVGALQGLPILKDTEQLSINLTDKNGEKIIAAKINYVAPTFAEVEINQADKAAIVKNDTLWYAIVPESHFYNKEKALSVYMQENNASNPSEQLLNNLTENLPDVFVKDFTNPLYFLQLNTAQQSIDIYQKKGNELFLRASFAAVSIDNNLFAAQRLPNTSIWQYYDLNDRLVQMPSFAQFEPLNQDFDEALAAAAYALELFERKLPISLAVLPNISFSNYMKEHIEILAQPFVKWTNIRQEASFNIVSENASFILKKGSSAIFQTKSQTAVDAYEIVEALKNIANFQKTLIMQNPHPNRLKSFEGINFKLQAQLNGQNISIPLDLNKPIANIISLPIAANKINTLQYSLQLAYNYEGYANKEQLPALYIAALWMGDDYSIQPIAHATAFKFEMNNKFMPLGLLQAQNIAPLKINEKILCNIKILIALKPFDTALLWQNGFNIQQSSSQRSHMRKYGNNASDWLAFSLPIELLAKA